VLHDGTLEQVPVPGQHHPFFTVRPRGYGLVSPSMLVGGIEPQEAQITGQPAHIDVNDEPVAWIRPWSEGGGPVHPNRNLMGKDQNRFS
jgi:hypothetical protein